MGNLKSVLSALLLPPGRIFVGVSGGLDSVVLLHLLQQTGRDITVLHVNHHLQAEANQWAAFVKTLADQYGCVCEICDLSPIDFVGENIEAQARAGRYAFFEKHLTKSDDMLFLAHHQQDQIETFFLNLQRGAGLAGLSAMPPIRIFGAGQLMRPLLGYSRSMLEAYAASHRLKWVQDPSNQDLALNRNFLRACALPLLRERWPHFDDHVATTVVHLQEARTVLDDYLQADLEKLGNPLDITLFKKLPASRHALLLQFWLKQHSGKTLSSKQLQIILEEVIGAAEDRQPLFEIPGLQLRRKKNKLLLA